MSNNERDKQASTKDDNNNNKSNDGVPFILGPFTWSEGPRSSEVGFFGFHALGNTKQKKPTPLDWCPPLHVNRVLQQRLKVKIFYLRLKLKLTYEDK